MLRHFTAGLLATASFLAPQPAIALEASAHVTDIETCLNLLSDAREAYLNGYNIKEFIQNTYEYGNDGHVKQPYVYVWLLPDSLDTLNVEKFTANSEYFIHPFRPLGPIGHPIHKMESSPYQAFALDLKNAKSKNEGYAWAVAYNFHTTKSKNKNLAHFEDDHKKYFIRSLIDGRDSLIGRRLIASCGYAETGILGPTVDQTK